MRNFVRQGQRVALALLAIGDVLEDEQHAMGMVARLGDLPGIQVEDAAAETGKIVLDLETFDRLVFRQHLLHQMAERRHVPLMLTQFGNAPAARLGLGDSEDGQERLAGRHDGHVVFEHDQRIADRVDDALGQLPVALALGPGRALLADILDGQQDGTVMVAGAEYLARIDQHRAPANRREIVLDLEPFDRCTMRDHALEQGAQGGDVPLPVSQFVDVTSLGLVGAGAERLVEGAIGRGDVEISVENDERAGDGLDNFAGGNLGHGFLLLKHYRAWAVVPHGSRDVDITRRACLQRKSWSWSAVYGLAKEVRAFDEQGFHLVGTVIAGRVEHTQFRPKRDGLARQVAPAKDRFLEIDIGKQRVDALGGPYEHKRFVHVARQEGLMTPVLNHHFRNFAGEHIVFDDQDHGHHKALFCRSLGGRGITRPGRPHQSRQLRLRWRGLVLCVVASACVRRSVCALSAPPPNKVMPLLSWQRV